MKVSAGGDECGGISVVGVLEVGEWRRQMGSVRRIFLRADQPVKKYILTELILLIGRARSSCCVYRQAVPP